MVEKLEVVPLSTISEHEERCSDFVVEITKTIVPKYPGLCIRAINETNAEISYLFGQIGLLKNHSVPDEDEIKRLRQMAREKDILSVEQNTALINVSGGKGRRNRARVNRFITEVIQLSSKLEYNPESMEIHARVYGNQPPQATLRFTFRTGEPRVSLTTEDK